MLVAWFDNDHERAYTSIYMFGQLVLFPQYCFSLVNYISFFFYGPVISLLRNSFTYIVICMHFGIIYSVNEVTLLCIDDVVYNLWANLSVMSFPIFVFLSIRFWHAIVGRFLFYFYVVGDACEEWEFAFILACEEWEFAFILMLMWIMTFFQDVDVSISAYFNTFLWHLWLYCSRSVVIH